MPAALSDSAASDVHLASALRIAVMRLARRLRAERTDEPLTLSQISALSTVRQHGPLSPSALAEFERVQPPSMTRIVTVLEERQLVERKPHERDGRVSMIALSEKGQQMLDEDRRRRDAFLARALESLSAEEIEILRAAAPIVQRLSEA